MNDEFLMNFEHLKISALTKLKRIKEISNAKNVSNFTDILETIQQPPDFSNSKLCDKKGIQDETVSEISSLNNVNDSLKMLETRRQAEVKHKIKNRVNQFEEFTRKQEEMKRRDWMKIQQGFIEDLHQKENHMLEAMNNYDKNTLAEHKKLVEYYQNLAEKRKVRELELHEKEHQKKILQINIEQLRKNQQNFRLIYQQVLVILKKCSNNDRLKNMIDDLSLLKTLPGKFEEITAKCRNGKIDQNEVELSLDLIVQLSNLKTKIAESVDQINNENQLASLQKPEIALPSIEKSTEKTPEQDIKSEKVSASDKLHISQYISITNLNTYTGVMNFLHKHTESFKGLENDPLQKEFRFDCKKAVNIPINSLSGVNSEHILDKYKRLHKLLKGEDVVVSDKRVNASKHPQGIAFCKDLLAKKFILQGDLMVSSSPESAFCYATVMVSLWNDFPDFGQLILGYFYKSCPYLVPYHIPREVGESDEDFYQKRGYQYTDGQIEKQDKFLKRMTGKNKYDYNFKITYKSICKFLIK